MSCSNAISVSKNEVVLRIHVIAASTQSLFPAGYNRWRRCIECKVKSSAKDNKANKEVVEKISKYFNIIQQDVTLQSGLKSREKTVSLKNVTKKDVCRMIEESLHGL